MTDVPSARQRSGCAQGPPSPPRWSHRSNNTGGSCSLHLVVLFQPEDMNGTLQTENLRTASHALVGIAEMLYVTTTSPIRSSALWKPCKSRQTDGGGGGNRTRVLEPRGQSVYARSLRFEFAEPVSRRPDTDPASSLGLSRSSRSEEARSSRLDGAHSPPAGAAGGASLLS
jgi:hypothetical protein